MPVSASEGVSRDLTVSFDDSNDVEDKLSTLSCMLHTVLDNDVYSVAMDNENKAIQLGWFHRLLEWLRKCNTRLAVS